MSLDIVSPDDDVDGEAFVETDPTGRYGRWSELLGTGAVKKVYRGFDLKEAKEVAWNQVFLRRFINDDAMMSRLCTEIHLVRSLKNDNILSGSDVWNDREKLTLNFITEICGSGNLRDYRTKHGRVSLRTVKIWSLQILKGLSYLHAHKPRVIHRDLNPSNVFINGKTGQVKIGDFGLASVTKNRSDVVRSMVGTPEFMAPEVYEESYDEAVDVYAFGLCVLELVTAEVPYSECASAFEVYEKVSGGVRPRALSRVGDSEVRRFIDKCLVRKSERPSASELLQNSFFDELVDAGDDDDNGDDTSFELGFDLVGLSCVDHGDRGSVGHRGSHRRKHVGPKFESAL